MPDREVGVAMTASRTTNAIMTVHAFLAWSERQGSPRHELFDGQVIAMAAERAIHARTKNAVSRHFERAIFEAQLPCEAFVDGMALRVDESTIFEPDAMVRCGAPLPDNAVVVDDTIVVVEVASTSTQRVDALLKLTRYFRNPTIVHYLIVMPDARNVLHHRRGPGERIETTIHVTGRLRLDPPGFDLEVEALFAPSPAGVTPPGAAPTT